MPAAGGIRGALVAGSADNRCVFGVDVEGVGKELGRKGMTPSALLTQHTMHLGHVSAPKQR